MRPRQTPEANSEWCLRNGALIPLNSFRFDGSFKGRERMGPFPRGPSRINSKFENPLPYIGLAQGLCGRRNHPMMHPKFHLAALVVAVAVFTASNAHASTALLTASSTAGQTLSVQTYAGPAELNEVASRASE